MIDNPNFVKRALWRTSARIKLNKGDIPNKYACISLLGLFGKKSDINRIINDLNDNSQIIRSATAKAIVNLFKQLSDINQQEIQQEIIKRFTASNSLIEKLACIEVIRYFYLQTREDLFKPILSASENDLKYAIIKALQDSKNEELLDQVLQSSETTDLILRKTALETWFKGISQQELDDILDYCTPRLHYLIRATYELQDDGLFLKNILSYSNKNNLPYGKAYPDFIIRYLTELLGKWEYDPEAYKSLHHIVIPSYFTFEDKDAKGDERPYLLL